MATGLPAPRAVTVTKTQLRVLALAASVRNCASHPSVLLGNRYWIKYRLRMAGPLVARLLLLHVVYVIYRSIKCIYLGNG